MVSFKNFIAVVLTFRAMSCFEFLNHLSTIFENSSNFYENQNINKFRDFWIVQEEAQQLQV